MDYRVEPGHFDKTILVPSSKSYANRLLILAAIKKECVVVRNISDSTDVLTMISCLEKIGIDIEREGRNVRVKNSFPECEDLSDSKIIVLNTGDGGTTNRFLLAFLARGKKRYILNPSGHMKNRPMQGLVDSLRSLQVEVGSSDEQWLYVQGPMTPLNEVSVDCSETTQYATGLLMSLSDAKCEVALNGLDSSANYLEITKSLIKNCFALDHNTWDIPIDFSSASYPLALAAVSGQVCIENGTYVDHNQPDSSLISILSNCHGEISVSDQGIICRQKQITHMDVDGSYCPDLIPTLCFLAAYAQGVSKLRNLSVLRHKESDRFFWICKIMKDFQVKFSVEGDNITIYGQPDRDKVDFCSPELPEDHRIIMMSYLFMRVNRGGSLMHSQHVEKSFPKFYKTMT